MRKFQTFKSLVLLGILFGLTAQAQQIAQPNFFSQEKIINESFMDVQYSAVDIDGVQKAHVLLLSADQENDAVEKIFIGLLDKNYTYNFTFVVNGDPVIDGCGSVHYYADEYVDPGVDYLKNSTPNRVIELIDHQKRHCRDFHQYKWELFLDRPSSIDSQEEFEPLLVLTGNPQN